VGSRDYRVLALRTARAKGSSVLHLVREDAEASLCGIPRPALDSDRLVDEFVCEDCIDWLLKRRAVSGQQRLADSV